MPEDARDELKAWARGLGVELDAASWARLASYLDGVAAANERLNLTADSGDDLWLKHAADGLAALPLLRRSLPPSPRLIDIGAGAGFVGVALKLAWSQAEVTLIEPSMRKFLFLNEAAIALGTRGLRVVRGAAPGDLRGKTWDAALVRAVAPLRETVRLAMPVVGEGGMLLVFQTEAPDPDEPSLSKVLAAAGARLAETIPYQRPRENSSRHLVIFQSDYWR